MKCVYFPRTDRIKQNSNRPQTMKLYIYTFTIIICTYSFCLLFLLAREIKAIIILETKVFYNWKVSFAKKKTMNDFKYIKWWQISTEEKHIDVDIFRCKKNMVFGNYFPICFEAKTIHMCNSGTLKYQLFILCVRRRIFKIHLKIYVHLVYPDV